MHVCKLCMYVSMHLCMYDCNVWQEFNVCNACYVCMGVCMNARMSCNVCNVCMYVRMYICYVCM